MAFRNPLTVEVTRGGMVESRHRGAAVVMDAKGNAVHAWGEIARSVYPRAAIKPLQALAVVETGAAEAFAVTDAELALASASHCGQPQHMDVVLPGSRGLASAPMTWNAVPMSRSTPRPPRQECGPVKARGRPTTTVRASTQAC